MRTRLTYPARFLNEKRALGFIRDNGLFSIGAQVVSLEEAASPYRVVIDTSKPDVVQKYLGQNMTPGVQWQRSELPA